ncbi:MAG TPA: cytochrome b/b6 domain-containing protein [Allosphingosinicella sp.]|nr:cytochrome b/b6 domain-containing protein [Allosphingosinicella sp.]
MKIWDWPTRLFHWLLVVLIPLQWWTAENDLMDLHMLAGIGIAALLLFRLIWGLIGSSTARFANFVRGPRAVVSYLNGRAAHVLGHNPLGGWSVVTMLALLSAQVGLGLFASDEDGLNSGPLSNLISYEASECAGEIHEQLFNVILILIALHVAAIIAYALFRRQNLVRPMLIGSGEGPEGAEPMRAAGAGRLAVAVLIAAAAAWWLFSRL